MTIHKKGKFDSKLYLMKNFGQSKSKSVTESSVEICLDYSTETWTLVLWKN